MEDTTYEELDGPWPPWYIPILGIVVAISAFALEHYLFHPISAALNIHLELPITGLLYILTIFAIPFFNWRLMGKKLKVIVHLVLCILTLSLYTWMTDTLGYAMPMNESVQMANWISFGLMVLITLYLLVVTAIDLHLFRKAHKQYFKISGRGELLLFATIIFGWLSVLWGANYFSAKLGMCKFPPAYTYFQEKELALILKMSLIKETDLGCKYLRDSSPIYFLIAREWSYQARNLPFTYFLFDNFRAGSYSNGMETYFYSHTNLEIYQFVWFQEEELLDRDIQKVLDLDFFAPIKNSEEFELVLKDIPGPEYQQYQCTQTESGVACEMVFAYKHIIVAFVILGPESTFQSVLPNAILEINNRLLELDENFPNFLYEATT